MIAVLLVACMPAVAMGQLVLGFCPEPPPYLINLNLEKYSGDWHVVAQSVSHPLKAADCQVVKYLKLDKHLSANYTFLDRETGSQKYRKAELTKRINAYDGQLSLKFDDFPRVYQFRVLKANYSNVAVEYICLPGAITYTASVTVLHRTAPKGIGENQLTTILDQLSIGPDLRRNLKIVNHSNC